MLQKCCYPEPEPVAGTGAGSKLDRLHNTGHRYPDSSPVKSKNLSSALARRQKAPLRAAPKPWDLYRMILDFIYPDNHFRFEDHTKDVMSVAFSADNRQASIFQPL